MSSSSEMEKDQSIIAIALEQNTHSNKEKDLPNPSEDSGIIYDAKDELKQDDLKKNYRETNNKIEDEEDFKDSVEETNDEDNEDQSPDGESFASQDSTASNLEELLENLQIDQDDARLVNHLNDLLAENPLPPPPDHLKRLSSLDLEGVAKYLLDDKCKNVVVMVGAGISTSAGIPDFRSPNSGIYSRLAKYNLPSPECMFEINYFKRNPHPFFELAKELFDNEKYRPTPCHYFIKMLEDKQRLLRLYTQNIDGLEYRTGLSQNKIVAAHGSFNSSTCLACGEKYDFAQMREKIYTEEKSKADQTKKRSSPVNKKGVQIPYCSKCNKSKRNIVKPDIVFFGERLPNNFYDLQDVDFDECDLLLIIGTSLSVQPFAGLIDLVKPEVPRVLVNREKCGERSVLNGLLSIKSGLEFNSSSNYRDVFLQGDSDSVCLQLIKQLGWFDEFKQLVKDDHPTLA